MPRLPPPALRLAPLTLSAWRSVPKGHGDAQAPPCAKQNAWLKDMEMRRLALRRTERVAKGHGDAQAPPCAEQNAWLKDMEMRKLRPAQNRTRG